MLTAFNVFPTPKPDLPPPAAPSAIQPSKSRVSHPARAMRAEDSDGWPVIVQLNTRWRVIRCKHDLQYIVQVRTNNGWRGRHYCRTKEALIRLASEHLRGPGCEVLTGELIIKPNLSRVVTPVP